MSYDIQVQEPNAKSIQNEDIRTSPKKTLLAFQPLDFPPQIVFFVASFASSFFRLVSPHPPSLPPLYLSLLLL